MGSKYIPARPASRLSLRRAQDSLDLDTALKFSINIMCWALFQHKYYVLGTFPFAKIKSKERLKKTGRQ